MRKGPTLGEFFDVRFGLKTGDDDRFIHAREGRGKNDKRLLRGDDVHRYGYKWNREYVDYRPSAMRQHRTTARPGDAGRFEQPKVLVKDTSKRLACSFDSDNHYVKDVLIVTPNFDAGYDLRFLESLINSKIMTFYYRTTYDTLHVQSGELKLLPLPAVDFTDSEQKAIHDTLSLDAKRLAEAINEKQTATTNRDEEYHLRRIQSLEARIENKLAALYGFSDAEMQVIASTVAELSSI